MKQAMFYEPLTESRVLCTLSRSGATQPPIPTNADLRPQPQSHMLLERAASGRSHFRSRKLLCKTQRTCGERIYPLTTDDEGTLKVIAEFVEVVG